MRDGLIETIFVSALTVFGCSTATQTPSPSPSSSTPSPAFSPAMPAPVSAVDTQPAASKADASKAAVAALIGTAPPEWQVERWIGSTPRTLESLRGTVVLVRWWTAGCPYCSTTAPALRKLHQTYAGRGLNVLGMYHHKEDTPFDPAVYEETARKYGFTFPVAFDPDWRTLESWLRDREGKAVSTGWTSVTFVLDKHGVIRHVHPGGSYVEGEASHTELQAAIEQLLAQP